MARRTTWILASLVHRHWLCCKLLRCWNFEKINFNACRVSSNNPSKVEQCTILGSCPGGLSFGVGTDDWRQHNGDLQSINPKTKVPYAQEACWNNGTLRFTDCFGQCSEACTSNFAGCVNLDMVPSPHPCFTSTTYISRLTGGSNSNGAYELKQGVAINDTMVRCLDQVGYYDYHGRGVMMLRLKIADFVSCKSTYSCASSFCFWLLGGQPLLPRQQG